MDAIGGQIGVKMTFGLFGSEKEGFFPDPGIRILPLDPMGGDMIGGFLVAGVSVVRDHTPRRSYEGLERVSGDIA